MMNIFAELKRRKVVRVAVVYAATAFAVLQAADIMLPRMGVPDWAMSLVVALALLGFPIALVLAWALELTPDGVKVTSPCDAAPTDDPPPSLLGKRTVLAAAALVILGIGLGAGWFLRPLPVSSPPTVTDEPAERPAIERSIAVLPFSDLSPERDQEYFSDGLAEEILNLLAAVRDLSVASRTSAFSFKGSGLPVPEIAGRLGVHYILEGSVRKAGERIRVTAQLIDARTDRHLWSENYDRTFDDIFAIQDEIAGAIGEALQVELFGARGEAVSAIEIVPELYEKFLKSRFLLRQRNVPAIARATTLLEEVVDGEPEFAPGLAQLAEAHLLAGVTDQTVGQLQHRFDRILELVERALAIDSRLAGAYAVRGNVAMVRGQQIDALHDYRRAIDLAPDDPRSHHWLAMLYAEAGHLDLGERSIVESLRLDPENANAEGYRGDLLAARGRWDEAGASARRVVELGNPVGHATAAIYLLAVDPHENLERAEAEMRLALAKGAAPGQVPLQMIAFARGEDQALESYMDDVRSGRMWLFDSTMILLALDRPDALLTLLERDDYLFGRISPQVWSAEHVAMRRDSRFADYLEHQGVTDLWRELGPPPDCVAEGDGFRCGLIGERDR